MVIVGYFLIIISCIFIFSGIIGLFRLPDFYTKIHAAGVLECCGAPMFLTGLAILQESYNGSIKLLISVFLIILLNPVSTHALGKAAVSTMHKLKQEK